MSYHIVINGQQQGPFDPEQLRSRGVRPETLVWKEGMGDWQRADAVPELRHLFASPASTAPPGPPPTAQPYGGHPQAPVQHYGTQPGPSTNRIAAGILAIVLGPLGIHKFILGYTGAGLIMLLVSVLTCGIGAIVMQIIGIIEGIIYLTKTDEQFYQEYVANRKEWF
jgi:TM2 domain-containing membrane protein YozV